MTDDELDAMIERGRNYVGGLRGENELKVGPAMSSYAIEQLVSGVEALRAERDRLREALEEIVDWGTHQPVALNMPEEDWLRTVIHRVQAAARRALNGGDDE